MPPLNVQDNVFKYKSTIPVKIRFTNCNGSAPAYLFPIIKVTKLSGSTSDFSQSPLGFINGIADLGLMRFSNGQYIYNLNTRDLPDFSLPSHPHHRHPAYQRANHDREVQSAALTHRAQQ